MGLCSFHLNKNCHLNCFNRNVNPSESCYKSIKSLNEKEESILFEVQDDNVIRLTRGDYACFDIEIEDFDGEPYIPGENEVVHFTVRKSTTNKDILIQKTGTTIEILGEDTDNLKYGTYVYDAQLTKENGRRFTFIEPTEFIITDEVTW